MPRNQELVLLEKDFGIHVPMAMDYFPEDMAMAQDAMFTTVSGGQPAYLTNYLDPELVRVLVAPMKAAIIFGETKKGDWTTLTTQFQTVEPFGEVTSYGDYNNNGTAGVNTNFIERQSYMYQTMTQWGERELDMAAAGRIALAQELNLASAIQLNKFQNKSYFLGIANLKCYGALNDPNLVTPIAPAATGTSSGTTWSTKTGDLVYADILLLYAQLVAQTGGLVDMETTMVLAMSPSIEVNIGKTNSFGINLTDLLKKNFKNLRIETAVEYATSGGQLVQLIVPEYEGTKTAYCAFTEKLRAHAVIQDVSSWKQKKSQGTWGTIIRRPMLIAQMLGV